MSTKRILVLGVVLVAVVPADLPAGTHLEELRLGQFSGAALTTSASLGLLAGIRLTYLAYVLRAVRWRIFLKPVCKTTTARLLAPQFIGFSALALLGRAGEMIRPYIIAKKERLTFTSQIAVWGVERIFDMGAFAVLLALSACFLLRCGRCPSTTTW